MNKMAITHLSIVILNVNGLSAPMKRHKVAECIIKTTTITKNNKIHSYAAYNRLSSDRKTQSH